MRHKYRPPHVSRAKIAAYWTRRFGDELSDPLPDDRCWTCNRPDGRKYPLHRCHLVAEGPGSADNLILLCQKCHAKQEKRDPGCALDWVLYCQAEQNLMAPNWSSWSAKTKEGRYISEALHDLVRRQKSISIGVLVELGQAIWDAQENEHFWPESDNART